MFLPHLIGQTQILLIRLSCDTTIPSALHRVQSSIVGNTSNNYNVEQERLARLASDLVSIEANVNQRRAELDRLNNQLEETNRELKSAQEKVSLYPYPNTMALTNQDYCHRSGTMFLSLIFLG